VAVNIPGVLAENDKKRLVLGLPMLICYALFEAWKDGVVYFSGTTLSLYGSASLMYDAGIRPATFVTGFLLAIVLFSLIPSKTVLLNRIAAIIAFTAALALFLPVGPRAAELILQAHFFCGVFMLLLEFAFVPSLFSLKTVMLYSFAALPLAMLPVAFLQNGFWKPDYRFFHGFMILATACQIFFFFRIPANVWPRYLKKSEGFVVPKNIFRVWYLIIILLGFFTLAEWTYAESVESGPLVYRLSCCVLGFACFFFMYRKFKVAPVYYGAVISGIMGISGILALASRFFPFLALPACVTMTGGWFLIRYLLLVVTLLHRKYPIVSLVRVVLVLNTIIVLAYSVVVPLMRENIDPRFNQQVQRHYNGLEPHMVFYNPSISSA
jgi:hypothetical protein